jgi:Xaa-Pro aminopeptidase
MPYADRRARLAAQMDAGAVAIVPTAREAMRNGDAEYPYRHDSYFHYLTGFPEPEAVLVLAAGKSILFVRDKHPERETWDGFRYGPEAARTAFNVDEAYSLTELDERMPQLLADAPALYYAQGHDSALDARVAQWLDAVRARGRTGVRAPETLRNVRPLLDEMRLLKDAHEVEVMRRAGIISGGAHARAMRTTRPGMFEYEIEAELLHEFRRHGSQFPAYTPIVASGAHTCTLHYHANNRRIESGDLVLIDAGCELDGYASDITRTYPANGKFTGPQRTLYELVLAAQQAALDAAKPGNQYAAMHDAALRVLVQGMLDEKLLTGLSVDDAIAERAYLPFYMHGTSHWLGMDVHDVGQYRDVHAAGKPSRALVPGMAVTVEPGIYVRPADNVPEAFWNIGIRIEDDVVITAEGCEILSASAPKQVADIEHLMRQA